MARMAAGVRKRADGSMEKRFTVKGKRYSVYGRSAKEIAQKEYDLRQALENNTYTENKNITLDKYFEFWLQEKRKSLKGSSIRGYKDKYNKHMHKYFGSRKLRSIERREIIEMQNSMLEAGCTARTVNDVVRLLKNILNGAVTDEIIINNPAGNVKGIKDDRKKASATIHRALTQEEQEIFMQGMKDNFYYEFVAFLLSTGLRVGEAAALTWNDIDYFNNVILVNKTLAKDENNKDTLNTPKSKTSVREIPLTNNCKALLKSMKEKTSRIKIVSIEQPIFYTTWQTPITAITINHAISQTIKALEEQGRHIDKFTVHALRDTFATRYIEQGGTAQTLKAILGHSSLSMTMDLYAHVLPNTKQEEMQRINIVI